MSGARRVSDVILGIAWLRDGADVHWWTWVRACNHVVLMAGWHILWVDAANVGIGVAVRCRALRTQLARAAHGSEAVGSGIGLWTICDAREVAAP